MRLYNDLEVLQLLAVNSNLKIIMSNDTPYEAIVLQNGEFQYAITDPIRARTAINIAIPSYRLFRTHPYWIVYSDLVTITFSEALEELNVNRNYVVHLTNNSGREEIFRPFGNNYFPSNSISTGTWKKFVL